MSLAARVERFELPHTNKCQTCAWYQALTAEDQTAFDTLAGYVDGGRISRAHMHRIVAEEGYPCTESSLKRHMRICRESG